MAENTSEFLIRKYDPADFERVKILMKSLTEHFGDPFDDFFFTDYMQMRLLDSTTGTFVAEIDGLVVGTCFTDIDRDARGFLHGQIMNLITDQEYRGKGIGAALINEALKFLSFSNVPNVWANCNSSDSSMQRLFEDQNFKDKFYMMENNTQSQTLTTSLSLDQDEVKYRSLIEKDLPAVRVLIQQLASIFDVDFDEFWFNLNAPNFFRNPAMRIFVAELEGQVVGTIFAEVRRDPLGFLYGYVSNIIIAEEIRGKGIGSNILKIATAFLSNLNINKIWGNVNSGNEIMKHIYEKIGFQHKFTVMDKQMNVSFFGGLAEY